MNHNNLYVLLKIENMIKIVHCEDTLKDLKYLYIQLYKLHYCNSIQWIIK